MIEVLPGSALPDDLRGLGYQLQSEDGGERILAGVIVEKFTYNDGELVPLIAGSTKPIAEVRRHAGIVKTERFTFDLP